MGAIQKQVKLPIHVAFGVAVQGIRIRLGRSMVTLFGVMLGIAFLMAILTGQNIRQGVSAENATRSELRRMLNFLTTETGPLRGRTLAVYPVGALNPLETRFLQTLAKSGVEHFRWAATPDAPAPDGLPAGKVERVPPGDVARDAVAMLVMGNNLLPRARWAEILAPAQQKLMAVTRKQLAVNAEPGLNLVVLERELRPEEIAQAELDARQTRFRTGWIIIISLLVTVIGISNAMLMSVTERFREIGTMKCLGALSAFIRQIFFIESSLMGLVGSLVGSALGCLFACGAFMLSYGSDLVLSSLQPTTLLLYFVGSVIAGIVLSVVAAIYPASFASRMVPATALRSTV